MVNRKSPHHHHQEREDVSAQNWGKRLVQESHKRHSSHISKDPLTYGWYHQAMEEL
jgi:hypothetical protein